MEESIVFFSIIRSLICGAQLSGTVWYAIFQVKTFRDFLFEYRLENRF